MQLPDDTRRSLRASLSQSPQDITALAALWRGQEALLASLPPRYGQALENILQRLETSASFNEESCSFSQSELTDALGVWLDRVEALPA